MTYNPDNRELQTATAPEIEILSLTTVAGDSIDLTPLLVDMDIFEDIFSMVLTGSIQINDTIGLFDKIPICGQEKLTVKIYSKDYQSKRDVNYIHRTFDVLRITDVVQINDYTKSYRLHFASPEFKQNESFKLSKGFFNTTISKVISSIMTGDFTLEGETTGHSFPVDKYKFKEDIVSPYLSDTDTESWYFKNTEEDCVELFVEKTKYIEPIISFPYMTSFDIIAWLTNKSIRLSGGRYGTKNKTQPANFLFFENKRGFQFVSLDTLLESKDKTNVVTQFTFGNAQQNKATKEGNRIVYREKIEALQIQDCYNIIQNLRDGVYASRLYSYDLSTGKSKTFDYDYIDTFYDTETTERVGTTVKSDFPQIPYNDEDLSKRALAHRSFVVQSPSRGFDNLTSEPTSRHSVYKETGTGPEEYLQKRLSQLARLNNFRVIMAISGNSKHKVGDCVELDLKTWGDAQGNTTKDFDENSARYYSGNYLITSIRHKLTKYNYNMNIELVKDSFKTKIGV